MAFMRNIVLLCMLFFVGGRSNLSFNFTTNKTDFRQPFALLPSHLFIYELRTRHTFTSRPRCGDAEKETLKEMS